MSAAVPLIRLVMSSFLFIFFVIAVWLLTAHDSHQGGDIFFDGSNEEVSTRVVFGHDQNNVAAASTAVRDNGARGRKMAAGKLVILPMAHETGAISRKQNRFAASEKSTASTTKMMPKQKKYYSRNWGDHAEENYTPIKGEKRELGRRRNLLNIGDEERSLGFVAFNADYHGPRHHPPKNN